jgi:two-component system, OmpR family, alkaline phosphatase synthesis response regulator PhoP
MDQANESTAQNIKPVEEPHKLVFVVEDDPDLQTILTYNLQKEGYAVRCFAKAETMLEVLEAAPTASPAVIVMDVNLAGNMNGMEATRFLRSRKPTNQLPVLMLTAKGDPADVVKGLGDGADDYLAKPFDMEIFMARLKACQRRAERNRGPVQVAKQKLVISGIEIDPVSHQVNIGNKDVPLTMTEFSLLFTLMSRPNEVLNRDDLLLRVMGPNKAVTARTIDVHVRALRAKMGRKAKHIMTVRGLGYKFVL